MYMALDGTTAMYMPSVSMPRSAFARNAIL